LVADVVRYSRLAGADEDRTLARLRALRSDLIDPTIAVHHGRIVKRTGDGNFHVCFVLNPNDPREMEAAERLNDAIRLRQDRFPDCRAR
jgi:class 3 adenylate cyclase